MMWTTGDDAKRRQADQWLQSFQAAAEAWQVATQLVGNGSSPDVCLFAATVLCNKLRGGSGGGLALTDAADLRKALLEQLQRIPAGRLQTQLCRAVASLVGCCDGDGSHPTIALLRDGAVATLSADALMEVLTLIPSAGGWRSAMGGRKASASVMPLVTHWPS